MLYPDDIELGGLCGSESLEQPGRPFGSGEAERERLTGGRIVHLLIEGLRRGRPPRAPPVPSRRGAREAGIRTSNRRFSLGVR